MNFRFILSKYATSLSVVTNVKSEINILKIEICLTITNKSRSFAKKNLTFDDLNNYLYGK